MNQNTSWFLTIVDSPIIEIQGLRDYLILSRASLLLDRKLTIVGSKSKDLLRAKSNHKQ